MMEEELKDLHRLHLVTKDFNHIIEYEPGSWKMFEPSKFVYAFFAFNTFYNFDWQKSCENKQLTEIQADENNNEPSQPTKFKSMIDFIFTNSIEEDKIAFIKFIKRPNKKQNPIPNNELIKYVEEITSDNKIKESTREDFKKAFKKLIETESVSTGKIKNDIVYFIYLVRNNIFHGTKTTIMMSDKLQRKRLEIYSNILIGINEILFRVLSRKLEITFDDSYRIKF